MTVMRTVGLAKFACQEPGCDFKGGSTASLRVHKARKHSGHNWSSIKKGTKFKKKGAAASAANGVAPAETAQPFACEKCDFVGKNEMSLKMHNRRMHTARGKTWKSPGTVNFKGKQGQREHQVAVRSGLSYCPRCGEHLEPYNLAKRFNEGQA